MANHIQSGLDETNGCRYLAPELQWLEDTDKILITKESDAYGMGMVAYEASFHRLVSSGPGVKSHVNFPGPDGEHSILRAQQYRCVSKDTSGGDTSTTPQQDY